VLLDGTCSPSCSQSTAFLQRHLFLHQILEKAMTSLSATRCSLRAPVAAKPCAARAQAKPAAMTKASKAGAAAAASLLASSPAIAAMEVAQVADSSPAIAVAGIAGIVGVGALLISQDPEKRCALLYAARDPNWIAHVT